MFAEELDRVFVLTSRDVISVPVPLFHVTAVVGDAVYLPCDITTGEGDAVLLVLWYREDLGTPIYSVDAREHQFRAAERWSDDNVFSNRADFMPDRQPAELGVDNIRKEDAGIYRCRVDFKIAQTRNSKVNLTVIGDYCNQERYVLSKLR
ncbi:uncharacterized protein LOC110835928 isoform X2 [Zootermopsis nevadensis]|uniref:uncharacterized protein LOC110835928 isoform X2 n=1 Tax=Zootermopsis nevadensis TaxID=136037 RepID=UPI000B8EBCEF|nr:uncharacterized protein LOC110835928 isoform X2 [Zootermopsis nevadensis]